MKKLKIANLRALAKNKGVSLQVAAIECGLSVPQVYNMNSNKTRRINFETIEKLCHFLECEPGDLFSWETGAAHAN